MQAGVSNAANIPELRRRILFTLFMLAVYRAGVQIPTPGINGDALGQFFAQNIAVAASACRRWMLRGNVDATGSYRLVLR